MSTQWPSVHKCLEQINERKKNNSSFRMVHSDSNWLPDRNSLSLASPPNSCDWNDSLLTTTIFLVSNERSCLKNIFPFVAFVDWVRGPWRILHLPITYLWSMIKRVWSLSLSLSYFSDEFSIINDNIENYLPENVKS